MMNNWRLMLAMGVMGAAVCLFQGCSTVPVTGGGTGTAVGSYRGNELRVTREVTLDAAWEVAKSVVRELQLIVLADKTQKNSRGGILTTLDAGGELVAIQVEWRAERLTEIRIRVGNINTQAHREEAELVYQKMKLRL